MKRIITTLAATLLLTNVTHAQSFNFNECEASPEKTTFRLIAPPDARGVKVRIYKDGVGGNFSSFSTHH